MLRINNSNLLEPATYRCFEPVKTTTFGLIRSAFWHGWHVACKSLSAPIHGIYEQLFARLLTQDHSSTELPLILNMPRDLKLYLIAFMDLQELTRLRQVNKEFNKLTSMDQVWRVHAMKIGCQIVRGIPIYKQVLCLCDQLLFKTRCNLWTQKANTAGVLCVPQANMIMLYVKQYRTFEAFAKLHRTSVARDTLVVWKRLFNRAVEQGLPIAPTDNPYPWGLLLRDQIYNSSQIVAYAGEFPEWLDKNKVALRHLNVLHLEDLGLSSLSPKLFSYFNKLGALFLGHNNFFADPVTLAQNPFYGYKPKEIEVLQKIKYKFLEHNPLTYKSFSLHLSNNGIYSSPIKISLLLEACFFIGWALKATSHEAFQNNIQFFRTVTTITTVAGLIAAGLPSLLSPHNQKS